MEHREGTLIYPEYRQQPAPPLWAILASIFMTPVGGTTDIPATFLMVMNSAAFSKFSSSRRQARNNEAERLELTQWQRGDQSHNGGAYTYDETSARLMLRNSSRQIRAPTFILSVM